MTKRTIEIKTAESDETPKGGNGSPDEDVISPERERPIEEAVESEDAGAAATVESGEEEAVAELTVEEQLADMTRQLQRLAAEFENYKKKNAREFERGHQAGSVRMIERLLSILDSFDSAVQSNTNGGEESLLEGFQQIHRQMIEALTGAGLEVIDPEQGTPLDPHVHEVLLTHPTSDVPEDTIFATLQRGYSYNGWLVRPAKVQVAKKPEA